MGSTLLKRERERERREMYLLLILLISPAFGRPSSDQPNVGAEIGNYLNNILLFSNETVNILFNSTLTEEVSKMLLEAEQSILEMQTELKTLQTEENQFEFEDYFSKFNSAKYNLRQSRQDLRRLADRTVADVSDMKILLEYFDETNEFILLKFSIDIMRELMIRTLETLKNNKENYNSALGTFDNFKITTGNQKLTKMLDEDSKELIRLSLISTCGDHRRLACLIFDVSALGYCGLVRIDCLMARCWLGGGCLDDDFVEKYTEEIRKLKRISDRMLKSGNNFDQALNLAIDTYENEIDIIGKWTQSAETVSDNIEEYPGEFLRLFKSMRTIYVTGLDELKNAAEEFLAQEKN